MLSKIWNNFSVHIMVQSNQYLTEKMGHVKKFSEVFNVYFSSIYVYEKILYTIKAISINF